MATFRYVVFLAESEGKLELTFDPSFLISCWYYLTNCHSTTLVFSLLSCLAKIRAPASSGCMLHGIISLRCKQTMEARDTTFSFDETAEERNCLFAVPKKGRLFEKVSQILAGTGLTLFAESPGCRHCTSLPITLVFLPAADIPIYVSEGNVDVGITGQDVVKESQCDADDTQTRLWRL